MKSAHRHWTTMFVAIALASISLASGCRGMAKLVVSDEMEEKIGRTADQGISSEFIILPRTAPATIWTTEMFEHLALHSEELRASEGFGGFKAKVLYDDELVNAFAAPGGYVYVTTGLILKAKSCAEVAGVMAHELAHVTNRHSVESMADSIMLGLAGQLIGAGDMLVGLTQGLAKNSFNRGQEREADKDGLGIVIRAGYNPKGMIDFFETLGADETAVDRALSVLSTHPNSAARMRRLRDLVNDMPHALAMDSAEGFACQGTTLTFEEVQASLIDEPRKLEDRPAKN